MNNQSNYDENNLKISDDVISTITSIAAKEVKGVAVLSSTPTTFKGIFKSKPSNKSVDVSINDGVAVIDIFLKIKYGARVNEVAYEIQQKVKDSVQNMTSIAVSKVNVHVTGIQIEEKNK